MPPTPKFLCEISMSLEADVRGLLLLSPLHSIRNLKMSFATPHIFNHFI
jgi:hypothetical protein